MGSEVRKDRHAIKIEKQLKDDRKGNSEKTDVLEIIKENKCIQHTSDLKL